MARKGWALALCAACLLAEALFAASKTHGYDGEAEAKREAAQLKKQVPPPLCSPPQRRRHAGRGPSRAPARCCKIG